VLLALLGGGAALFSQSTEDGFSILAAPTP